MTSKMKKNSKDINKCKEIDFVQVYTSQYVGKGIQCVF